MSLSGASGSAAGYADLILKIAMFVSSVYNMINVFLLRNITCHILLFGAKIFFMMMLMTYYLDKHIYDIMQFLLASILWNKLNMNLPNFLTYTQCDFNLQYYVCFRRPHHLPCYPITFLANSFYPFASSSPFILPKMIIEKLILTMP